jgi:hypothetical protein
MASVAKACLTGLRSIDKFIVEWAKIPPSSWTGEGEKMLLMRRGESVD